MSLYMDEQYMEMAIEVAKAAPPCEVPVGAIVVKDGEVIARAHNERESALDATAHAEILAIRRACLYVGDWNLSGCELYVTLEPCPMCAGAINMSRISRLVYGATSDKDGAVHSICSMMDMPFSHNVRVKSGVLARECAELVTNFFKKERLKA